MGRRPRQATVILAPVAVNAGGAVPAEDDKPAGKADEEVAAYLLDLLIGARHLAVARRHRFLAYLIGMAAEEARLLTQGRSATTRG